MNIKSDMQIGGELADIKADFRLRKRTVAERAALIAEAVQLMTDLNDPHWPKGTHGMSAEGKVAVYIGLDRAEVRRAVKEGDRRNLPADRVRLLVA